MLKKWMACIICVALMAVPLCGVAEEGAKNEIKDELFEDVFCVFAPEIGSISFKDVSEKLEKMNYSVEETLPTSSALGKHTIGDEDGKYIHLMYFPKDINAKKSLDTELLCLVQMDVDKYSVSISNSLHQSRLSYTTYDKTRNPANQEVSTMADIVKFYNEYMGGNVDASNAPEKEGKKADEDKINSFIESAVREYNNSYDEKRKTIIIDEVRINPNSGTTDGTDYIVLVDLTWKVKNPVDSTKEMLTMYSNDLAARAADKCENVTELCMFWTVPFYQSSGSNAKFAYERRHGKMYSTDTVFSLEK